jgi:hypothetical protein
MSYCDPLKSLSPLSNGINWFELELVFSIFDIWFRFLVYVITMEKSIEINLWMGVLGGSFQSRFQQQQYNNNN